VDPAHSYSDKQYQALLKRIAATNKNVGLVNSGKDYLNLDANPNKKTAFTAFGL